MGYFKRKGEANAHISPSMDQLYPVQNQYLSFVFSMRAQIQMLFSLRFFIWLFIHSSEETQIKHKMCFGCAKTQQTCGKFRACMMETSSFDPWALTHFPSILLFAKAFSFIRCCCCCCYCNRNCYIIKEPSALRIRHTVNRFRFALLCFCFFGRLADWPIGRRRALYCQHQHRKHKYK